MYLKLTKMSSRKCEFVLELETYNSRCNNRLNAVQNHWFSSPFYHSELCSLQKILYNS